MSQGFDASIIVIFLLGLSMNLTSLVLPKSKINISVSLTFIGWIFLIVGWAMLLLMIFVPKH